MTSRLFLVSSWARSSPCSGQSTTQFIARSYRDAPVLGPREFTEDEATIKRMTSLLGQIDVDREAYSAQRLLGQNEAIATLSIGGSAYDDVVQILQARGTG